MGEKKFSFIVSDGLKLSDDHGLRRLIRREAMRDAGIARRKRTESQRVQRGTPSSDSSSDHSSDTSKGRDQKSTPSHSETYKEEVETPDEGQLVATNSCADISTQDLAKILKLSRNPPTAYEQLRSRHAFDIRDLSILTSFNVGNNTLHAILARPQSLKTLFGSQLQSYLHYLPSRYGHKKFLTAAVDCLVAKANSKLDESNSRLKAVTLRLHTRALAALQDAIVTDSNASDPDLLCAVQLLGVYEILDSQRSDAYLHHVSGSAMIMQKRTPSRFKSEYEKLLFHAHLGPMFTEALFHQTSCYLEQPEWMEVYESLMEDTPWLTDRSPIIIRTRMRMLSLASLLPATTEVMDLPHHDDERVTALERKTRQSHEELHGYLDEYNRHVMRTSMAQIPDSELALRREVFGSALECLLVYKRILATFCEEERLQLEREVQDFARQIFDLQNQSAPRHSWLYMDHEMGVAASVQLTKDAWEEDLRDASIDEHRLAARLRWKEFNNYLHAACYH